MHFFVYAFADYGLSKAAFRLMISRPDVPAIILLIIILQRVAFLHLCNDAVNAVNGLLNDLLLIVFNTL